MARQGKAGQSKSSQGKMDGREIKVSTSTRNDPCRQRTGKLQLHKELAPQTHIATLRTHGIPFPPLGTLLHALVHRTGPRLQPATFFQPSSSVMTVVAYACTRSRLERREGDVGDLGHNVATQGSSVWTPQTIPHLRQSFNKIYENVYPSRVGYIRKIYTDARNVSSDS